MMNRIESEYARIRAQRRSDRDNRVREMYRTVPALKEISAARAALLTDVGKGLLTADAAKQRNDALTAQEDALLKAHGYTREDMELRYCCDKCRDTGHIGQAPCRCRLLMEAALDPEQSVNSRETFQHFDENLYANPRQKALAMKLRDYCVSFADALPTPEKPFLLILGDTGLGKSFFGNAVAYRALERGIPAKRITAYAWQENLLKSMRNSAGGTDTAVTVPLLSLDDLGSEPDIPNVTAEHLFALINERLMGRRPTVIGTNLSLTQLSERYGDRIFSRLTDKSLVAVVRLEGDNLRRRLRPC